MIYRTLRNWKPPFLAAASIALHAIVIVLLISLPAIWRWLLVLIVADHLLITVTGLWPRSTWLGSNWTALPPAACLRNEIALTIDDGPDPEVTPQVLTLLEQYQIRASFFCIADKIARYPDLSLEIIKRGHRIENHSQHHRHNFSLLGIGRYYREIQSAQNTISSITGQTPRFFRAPAGLRNLFLDPVLRNLHLQLASWSVRGYDTRVNNAALVRNKLVNGLRPGAILLLHDGNAARTDRNIPIILEVLPYIIKAAASAQLHFVTLHEALD